MATHITPHHPSGTVADGPRDLDARPFPRLLSAAQVAELLDVPRSFVYSLARQGSIPTVRLGDRYVRFRGEAIADWLREREDLGRRHAR